MLKVTFNILKKAFIIQAVFWLFIFNNETLYEYKVTLNSKIKIDTVDNYHYHLSFSFKEVPQAKFGYLTIYSVDIIEYIQQVKDLKPGSKLLIKTTYRDFDNKEYFKIRYLTHNDIYLGEDDTRIFKSIALFCVSIFLLIILHETRNIPWTFRYGWH